MTTYVAKKTDKKGFINFNDVEQHTWRKLITRQREVVNEYACDEFISGLNRLDIPNDHIPSLGYINKKLVSTNWKMVPVHGTIGVSRFFEMLKTRHFPVATFIRTPDELDYLKQPDIFHEIFGHAPLLVHPAYADFVQWFGSMGSSLPNHLKSTLSRLFWYTIEFGLIHTCCGLKAYGGGILSSYKETLYALTSSEPRRMGYNLDTILTTPYDYVNIQPHYFIIESWDVLYQIQDKNRLIASLNKILGKDQLTFILC